MQKANIIVMGKTGAGKSTLINALLNEKVANTGIGCAITKENQLYTRELYLEGIGNIETNIYDTVGLEIDEKITNSTLEQIEKHIRSISENAEITEISAVWFCLNYNCSRFEKYELELIRKLSLENEIPFIIVITQCYENQEGELEKQVRKNLGNVPVVRVLAEDYRSRIGTFPAFGVKELFTATIVEYKELKVSVLDEQFNQLCQREKKIKDKLAAEGQRCVEKYTSKATKVGFLPIGCIPFVHGINLKMVSELNRIFGIKAEYDGILADFLAELVFTPFMAVPLLSAATANACVSTTGEDYLKALILLSDKYSNIRMEDSKKMVEELKKNIAKGTNK